MRRNRITIVVAAAAATFAVLGAVVALAATGSGSSNYGYGPGMMGRSYVYRPAQATRVRTLAEARTQAQTFADRLGLRIRQRRLVWDLHQHDGHDGGRAFARAAVA